MWLENNPAERFSQNLTEIVHVPRRMNVFWAICPLEYKGHHSNKCLNIQYSTRIFISQEEHLNKVLHPLFQTKTPKQRLVHLIDICQSFQVCMTTLTLAWGFVMTYLSSRWGVSETLVHKSFHFLIGPLYGHTKTYCWTIKLS